MKFDLVSDLHLSSYQEGNLMGFKPTSPVLALLGDICEVVGFKRMKKFFEYVSANWVYTLYVPGNHEFYKGHIDHSIDDMREYLKPHRNIVILDNDVTTIDNVRYIGSTLWSDMNREDPLTKLACKDLINDYRFIAKSVDGKYVRIEPEDTVRLYDKNVDFIAKMLELSDEPFNVVLTHHAPSYKSVSPHFIGNAANGAFVSNLEDFILDRPKIRVWAHGHTHSPCDYRIGECRVVGNPLGYGRELYKNDHEYKPITIEVLR